MAVDSAAPTGAPKGAANPNPGTVAPWASFAATTREHVPELQEPRAPETYDRILTDAQAWSLFTGTVLPIEDYGWWVHPNGNDEARVALLAEDVGLPMFANASEAATYFADRDTGQSDLVERTSLPGEFDFGELLHEALFALAFGRYYFNWSGEIRDGRWRLVDMAPLHPSTVTTISADRRGNLEYVVQRNAATFSVYGGMAYAGPPPKITQAELVPFVFWPDSTRKWLGRSLFRPLYRNWLCKDVLIRVDVTNHERAGGVPWIETDERYQGKSLDDLQRLASEFRVDEEGGAALPPGALLRLARAGGTDIVGSIRYHDEQMSKVWAAMVRELGATPNGSRALGQTMVDLETLARRAIAGWFAKTVNRWVMARWWLWNYGERNAPVVRFTPPALEAGAAPLPVAVEPLPGAGDTDPALEVAARGRPTRAATGFPSPRPAAAAAAPPSRPMAEARSRVPSRALRRDLTPLEVAAGVDFAAIDAVYEDTAAELARVFRDEVLPEQLDAVRESIAYTRTGTERVRITADAMAKIEIPVVGSDALVDRLTAVAVRGAAEAAAELTAQGAAVFAPGEDAVRAVVADHARAISRLVANGVGLAVTRRAVQMARSGLSSAELAEDVAGHVGAMAHTWETDQLAGATQQALNAGRMHVFAQVEGQGTAYASEVLDAATCEACAGVDGREYPDMQAALRDYPSGGFRDCRGGPRCRGTVVVVMHDEVPYAGDGPPVALPV